MGANPAEQNNNSPLDDYVTLDEATTHVFPLLLSQLEIANQQLADGVDTLIQGFTWMSERLNELDKKAMGIKIPDSMRKQIERIHRFTADLTQAGNNVHDTSVAEALRDEYNEERYNINRIVIRTLDMQKLSCDIREQAEAIVKELEEGSHTIIERGIDGEADAELIKTVLELQMEVNRMVVAFQFQDRVFQILSAVINAMKDVTDYITEVRSTSEEPHPFVSLSEMLAHVERYYISAEQYELKGEHKDDTSDDIELF